jgi:hypothetical protein
LTKENLPVNLGIMIPDPPPHPRGTYPPPYSCEQLVRLAEAFLAHADIGISTLGLAAVGNNKFFGRLAQGYDCLMSNAERATDWFNHNWPADLAWPHGVPDRRRRDDREGEDGAIRERRGTPSATAGIG